MSTPAKHHPDFNIGPTYAGGQHPVKTGNWRVFQPILDISCCKMCLICQVCCPDGAIKRKENSLFIDYDYCKGCGICALECNSKAISMARE